jgi:hypothetical protein
LIWIFVFVIALLLIALVAFFIATYSDVKVDLSLPTGIRLKLNGKKYLGVSPKPTTQLGGRVGKHQIASPEPSPADRVGNKPLE